MKPLVYLAPTHKLTQTYLDLHARLEKGLKKRRKGR
jgi:hypothetical protein